METYQGVIYKSTGSHYQVRDRQEGQWTCRIRGKLKLDTEISSTNPVAVGDEVIFQPEDAEQKLGTIVDVLPRKNYIVRMSPRNRFQTHILAANLDLAVLVATLKNPRTSQGFIDRFLVTAEAYHLPALIVFNKIDLLEGRSLRLLEEKQAMYREAGYPVLGLSATERVGLPELLGHIGRRRTLFTGHSGSGKTTLINALIPGLELKVQSVSGWSGKGQHTTTFAQMFDLPENGGRIIDTPGIKELGVVYMEQAELSHYFPEMRSRLAGCRFNNCLHRDEPGCGIKAAVDAGQIHPERYQSYLNILESL